MPAFRVAPFFTAPLAARLAALSFILASACVTTGTHNEKMAELNKRNEVVEGRAKEQDAANQEKIKGLEKKLADTEAQLKETQAKLADIEAKLAAANAARDDLSKQLDQSVQKLTGEKSQLFQTLAAARSQLEELNKQKAAAEARAATYRELTQKLRAMTDAGQLQVKIRDGRMLIALPNDVLFESGKALLKQEGKDAIAKVTDVLKTLTDRKFQVAGFTDDDAIHTTRFPSNWELSTARAVDVVRFMIAQGMPPASVAAVGYGEFAPVVPNDSDEHKAQNRRIEIALQPNISELPSMEEPK